MLPLLRQFPSKETMAMISETLPIWLELFFIALMIGLVVLGFLICRDISRLAKIRAKMPYRHDDFWWEW